MASEVRMGWRVRTMDGEELGTVKVLGDGAFKVDAPGEPDYWLPASTVAHAGDQGVRLAVSSSHIGEMKAVSPEAAMMPDALKLLIQMHDEAKAAFGEILEAGDTGEGRDLWRSLQPVLTVHEEMEDRYLYGPLQTEAPDDSVLRDWEAVHEHQVAELNELIAETDHLELHASWPELIETIRETLERHVAREEGVIFPRIREAWGETRLAEAGRRMRELKDRRLGRAA